MSTREYRSAAKGESWKFRLMNTIDQCMRYAASREEFISLMESEGYQVRWTDSRRNITYTTPTGMKCRDDRLHEEKYTKEVMEDEFRIRAATAHGGIEAEERSADYDTAELSQQEEWQELLHRLDELEQHTATHSPSAGGFQPEELYPTQGRRRRWRGMWRKYRHCCDRLGRRKRFLFLRPVWQRRCQCCCGWP